MILFRMYACSTKCCDSTKHGSMPYYTYLIEGEFEIEMQHISNLSQGLGGAAVAANGKCSEKQSV